MSPAADGVDRAANLEGTDLLLVLRLSQASGEGFRPEFDRERLEKSVFDRILGMPLAS